MAKKRKRKTPPPDLPLFDLPLRSDAEAEELDVDLRIAAGPAEAGEESAEASPGPTELEVEEPAQDIPREAPGTRARSEEPAQHIERPVQKSLFEVGEDTPNTEDGEEDLQEISDSAGGEEIPAPFSQRLRAGLADLMMHALMLAVAMTAAYRLGVELHWSYWPPFAGLTLIFSFVYWMVPVAFWGQTPGMAWAGQAARSLGDEPLTFYQAFLRWIGALLTTALAGLPLLLSLGARGSLSDRLSESKTVSL